MIIYQNSMNTRDNFIQIIISGDLTVDISNANTAEIIDMSELYQNGDSNSFPNLKMFWRELLDRLVKSGMVKNMTQANNLVPYEHFVNSIVYNLLRANNR